MKSLDELIRELRAKGYSRGDMMEKALDEGHDEDDVQALLDRLPKAAAPAPSPRQARNGGRKPVERRCDASLLKAPYRFVALNEQVVQADAVSYGTPLAGGLCATIDVRWVAETPLLIGCEHNEIVGPQQLWDGDADAPYVVPGASLRGMLRAGLEIVAFGRLSRINAHHRYGLRDFEHPAYRDGAFPLSDVDQVKTGWLQKQGDGYFVTPCAWSQVEIAAMPKVRDAFDWTNWDLMRKYGHFGMQDLNFRQEHSFSRAEDINSKATLRADPNGAIKGVYVFADKVPNPKREAWEKSGKKVEYVFHDVSDAAIALSPAAMAQFQRMYSKPSKNKSAPTGTWALLQPKLDKGGRIPIFYVGDLDQQEGDFAFGLTRLFKVPHRHSVEAIAGRSQKAAKPRLDDDAPLSGTDFVENLFGYVFEEDGFDYQGRGDKPKAVARKGRLAFSFARFENDAGIRRSAPVTTVMMGARASFAPFYLSGKYKDYSDDHARLAGRKRYLPRYPGGTGLAPLQEVLSQQRPKDGNDKITTQLQFLLPSSGTEMAFTSQIRLHNVSPAELGAVLWVLTHGGQGGGTGGPCRHMLGRAKAFGAGQIRVDRVGLNVVPNDPSALPLAQDSYVQAFEDWMTAKAGRLWRTSPPVTEFLACAIPANGAALAAAGKLDYLSELKSFGAVRKMTKLHHNAEEPCPPHQRYLTTPTGKSG